MALNVLISKSNEDLRAKERHPDYDFVVAHAQKHHGLSIADGRESLFRPLKNGSFVDKATPAGLTSLFAKDESNTDIAESTREDGVQYNNLLFGFWKK